MRPDDFWNLSLTEFWWEFDAKIELNKKLQETVAGNGKKKSAFTAAEWEAARKKFREKENGTADGSSR